LIDHDNFDIVKIKKGIKVQARISISRTIGMIPNLGFGYCRIGSLSFHYASSHPIGRILFGYLSKCHPNPPSQAAVVGFDLQLLVEAGLFPKTLTTDPLFIEDCELLRA